MTSCNGAILKQHREPPATGAVGLTQSKRMASSEHHSNAWVHHHAGADETSNECSHACAVLPAARRRHLQTPPTRCHERRRNISPTADKIRRHKNVGQQNIEMSNLQAQETHKSKIAIWHTWIPILANSRMTSSLIQHLVASMADTWIVSMPSAVLPKKYHKIIIR